MKLIDKDALVAEIDRRLDELYELLPNASKVERGTISISEACNTGKYTALESFKDYLDTLEVKEVDLDYIKDELDRVVKIYKPDGDFGWGTLYNIATHFFELGISVSNSTKVTTTDVDDVLKENGVNPDSKEAKIIKESYFMAIEKLAQKGEEV